MTEKKKEMLAGEACTYVEDDERAKHSLIEEEILFCISYINEQLSLSRSESAAKKLRFALKVLRNKASPLGKKRQVMRGVCGDYRAKMKIQSEQCYFELNLNSDSQLLRISHCEHCKNQKKNGSNEESILVHFSKS